MSFGVGLAVDERQHLGASAAWELSVRPPSDHSDVALLPEFFRKTNWFTFLTKLGHYPDHKNQLVACLWMSVAAEN